MSKFALLIGINYIGTSNELYGCINDTIMMRKYLIEKRGYNANNIITLRDGPSLAQFKMPTKENILNEIKNLINKANTNNAEEIFLHYSGHGSNIRDTNGDERNGYDDIIYPIDFNYIADDELRANISHINNNTAFYIIMDCCFSATNVDLPYLYTQQNNLLVLQEDNSKKYPELLNKNIYSFSGCTDNQTSADLYKIYPILIDQNSDYSIMINNTSGGALSATLIATLINNSNNDIIKALTYVQSLLKMNGLPQVPLLSSSKLLTPIIQPPPAPIYAPVSIPASKPASKPTSKPTSKPASKPASKPNKITQIKPVKKVKLTKIIKKTIKK